MMNTHHLPAWLSVSRQRRLAALASGLLLLFAWLWRVPLEVSMASHMLVQIPVLLIAGYLAARPLQATGLGFHQYDGKIADYFYGIQFVPQDLRRALPHSSVANAIQRKRIIGKALPKSGIRRRR